MGVRYDLILGKLREGDSGGSTVPTPTLYSGVVDPNGVVTAGKAGDEYINTATGHKWYAQAATNSARKEFNYME